IEFDPAWLAGFPAETRSRRSIDALFADATEPALARADRLVDRWLEVVFAEAAEDDAAALAQAAAYATAQALGRYLAATTAPPSPLAGGLRTVAAEALALVARHRSALGDREAHALLGVLDPLLRASVARLCRERPDGWAAAVAAQAERLATQTGYAGAHEWADAVAVQHAAREVETDEAIDALHTACYLSEGKTAVPCMHAARALLAAGRGPAAFAVLCAGLGAAGDAWSA